MCRARLSFRSSSKDVLGTPSFTYSAEFNVIDRDRLTAVFDETLKGCIALSMALLMPYASATALSCGASSDLAHTTTFPMWIPESLAPILLDSSYDRIE